MAYIKRALSTNLVSPPYPKVAILEGARAVGKTTLVQQSLVPAGYSYVTLAEQNTLALAKANVSAWVKQLQLPAVIDEAQLIPGIPLAVKELVDKQPAKQQIVLTGSASIGRTGLGGADPLVRRARRYTLWPFTQWELAGGQSSIADILFDAEITSQNLTADDDMSLLQMMSIGGFPDYVLSKPKLTPAQMSSQIKSDIAGLLTQTVLPDTDFSSLHARTILEAVLRVPGGIFSASRFGQSLGIDRRTIDRYLGILARLFLIHWLPNLATSPSRQDHTRAKIHPVDTSFAVAAISSAGISLPHAREQFGQLLESWVVNQIVASVGWSKHHIQLHYWRDATLRDAEVDLVLTDEMGRRVGIEIKAISIYDPKQLRGLTALARQNGIHRGFLFHTGNELYQVAENIWLIPITALGKLELEQMAYKL